MKKNSIFFPDPKPITRVGSLSAKTQAKNSHACAPLNKVLFIYNLGKKIWKYIAFTEKSTTNPNDTPATTEKGNSKRKQTFFEKNLPYTNG